MEEVLSSLLRRTDAFETLLMDVTIGDATLFMRADQAEAASKVITPVLDAWESVKPTGFPEWRSNSCR